MSDCKFDEYVERAVDNLDSDKGYKSLKQVLESCNCDICKKLYEVFYK